mmetsp:Transcript_20759/g.64834  ORF Transcript_20759/g.64834 Transcript_20759/m.64834 type:complete len:296 (+) Transcript_20759:1004-1891(+)
MSKISVIAIVDLQTYTFWLGDAKVAPARSRNVNHPADASLQADIFRCTSEDEDSSRGPSNSSKTSSRWSARTTLDFSSNAESMLASRVAHRKGFSLLFRNGVPWLPLRVTQPVAPSRRALPRTRETLASTSSVGPSRTSKSSPCSSFRTAVAAETSKLFVIATSFSHFANSCKALAKPGLRKPCRPNSLKTSVISSFLRPLLEMLFTNFSKLAKVISPLPPETSSKSWSTLFLEVRALVRSTSRACFVAAFATCAWVVRTASVAVRNLLSAAVARDVSFVSSTRASRRRFRTGPL